MKYFYPANALPFPLCSWFSRCCFKSRLLLAFVFSIAMHKGMNAQTTLAAGDIVFTSYNAVPAAGSAPDTFSFVVLTPMSSGTTIYFTERGFQNPGWQGSGGTEGTITCVTSSVLAIGDEVQVAGVGGSAFTRNGVPIGSVSVTGGNAVTGLSLSNAGDQIIAFQGGGGDPAARSLHSRAAGETRRPEA